VSSPAEARRAREKPNPQAIVELTLPPGLDKKPCHIYCPRRLVQYEPKEASCPSA
jgi:hypothetical protein